MCTTRQPENSDFDIFLMHEFLKLYSESEISSSSSRTIFSVMSSNLFLIAYFTIGFRGNSTSGVLKF